MSPAKDATRSYSCPMHADVRQPGPTKCPKCGMDLVPESARFAMLRHLTGNPWMLAAMVAVMVAIMAAVMMP
jgi:hypothetical protein